MKGNDVGVVRSARSAQLASTVGIVAGRTATGVVARSATAVAPSIASEVRVLRGREPRVGAAATGLDVLATRARRTVAATGMSAPATSTVGNRPTWSPANTTKAPAAA
jgi:hypothetical protein